MTAVHHKPPATHQPGQLGPEQVFEVPIAQPGVFSTPEPVAGRLAIRAVSERTHQMNLEMDSDSSWRRVARAAAILGMHAD